MEPQSGPGSPNQGQRPSIEVKDCQSESETLNWRQLPLIGVRGPESGPGTLNQIQGPSIKARGPLFEPNIFLGPDTLT